MSKKRKRTLAGFESVASNNININNNKENNIDDENKDGVYDELYEKIELKNQPKDKTHKFRGYYLENEVVKVIDEITKGMPKGYKSDLVNDILKGYFIKTKRMDKND